jgi:hypothetical protein
MPHSVPPSASASILKRLGFATQHVSPTPDQYVQTSYPSREFCSTAKCSGSARPAVERRPRFTPNKSIASRKYTTAALHRCGNRWRQVSTRVCFGAQATNLYNSPSSQTELWPKIFYLQLMNQRPLLREVHEWVKANAPPMCMFMPDRLQDTASTKANEEIFKNLAHLLMQTQSVSGRIHRGHDELTSFLD